MSDEHYEDETETTEIPAEAVPKGCITITLDTDQYLSGTLEGIIVESLVRQLSGQIKDRVADAVTHKVTLLADQEFARIARQQLDEFFSKPHQKTNEWGDATGTEVTIREMLVERFARYLDQRVDSNGREERNNSYPTRLDWLLRRLADEPLQEAIDERVGAITKTAKERIQQNVSRWIAEQLAPEINVPRIDGK